MTPRERLLTTLAHQRPDKVPKDISWGLTPALLETFRNETGCNDPDEYFGTDIRFVGLGISAERRSEEAVRRRAKFGPYLGDLPGETRITEWGTAHVPGSYLHFTQMVKPMQRFLSVSDLEAYPFPSFGEEWRLAHSRAEIRSFHERGLAVGGAMAETIFETAWELRGMQELFLDFVDHPGFAAFLLDRITDVRCDQARFFAERMSTS